MKPAALRIARARARRGQSLIEILVILACLALALSVTSQRLGQATWQGAARVGAAVRDLRPLAAGAESEPAGAATATSGPASSPSSEPVTLEHIQLVSSVRGRAPQYPGLPPLPGSPGGPPPGAVATVAGAALAGCVAGGAVALAGVVTSVGAPVTCAGGALIAGAVGIAGVIAAPAVGHALESVAHSIGGLFGGDDSGDEGSGDSRSANGEPTPEEAARRHALGEDPATGQFRPNEEATAVRVEQQQGTTLERYQPGPGEKGDWIDEKTGDVYDGCSPAPSEYFDRQFSNFQNSLSGHLNHPTVDKVVVDTTDLNLSPSQTARLEQYLDGLPPDQQARLVRIGS